MMHAELEAMICSGSLKGKQQTYALLEERAPKARRLDRDEALAELVLRFLTGHAPAAIKHFVWWSGLTVADAKRGIAAVKHKLGEPVVVDGTEWYGLSTERAPREKISAFLIPEYDEALTGGRDLGAPDLPIAKPHTQWTDIFYRPVIVDYRRAGTWKRTIGTRSAEIELNLFARLETAHRSAVEKAVGRYSLFLDRPVTIAQAAR